MGYKIQITRTSRDGSKHSHFQGDDEGPIIYHYFKDAKRLAERIIKGNKELLETFDLNPRLNKSSKSSYKLTCIDKGYDITLTIVRED